MLTPPTDAFKGYRFPREIISHAVWLYDRFSLSLRDVEDLTAFVSPNPATTMLETTPSIS